MKYQTIFNILALVLILHLVYLFGYYDGARHSIYIMVPQKKRAVKYIKTDNVIKADFKKSTKNAGLNIIAPN